MGRVCIKFTPTGTASFFARNGLLYYPEAFAFTNDAGVPLLLPPIPEASTWTLVALGLPALLGSHRFSRRSTRPSREEGQL